MSESAERWAPVVGYRGLYEVSDAGNVRSLDRAVIRRNGAKYTCRGMVLRTNLSHYGYPKVTLARQGVLKTHLVHWLVLEAFVGACPPGQEGCHNDGDRTNNKLDNLRYDTRKGNQADSVKHGTHVVGSRTGTSRLVEAQAVEMRNRYAAGGVSVQQLAAVYTVSPTTVSNVLARKTWRHVEGADCTKQLGDNKKKAAAKLTEQNVKTIRKRRAAGERPVDLAEEFGISAATVSNIVARRIWKDV